jgi:hypothetical protein
MSIVFKCFPSVAAHAETTTRFKLSILSAITAAALIGAPAQAAPTVEQQVEQLGKEVDELKQEVARQKASPTSMGGHGGDAGKTTIGGYGELHYNSLDSKDEIDFHRFVLFFGHRFSDRISFYSELEVEHTQVGEGKNGGEVAMEQAFLNFDLTDSLSAKAGIILVPVGILNETHEPPIFYGVERNPVETNIIPTTWREAGAALVGRIGQGFGYDLMLSSGLKVATSGTSAYNLRSGRQSGRQADANNAAVTARVKWTGAPGVELAATVQRQDDIAQATVADDVAGAATLWEAHAALARGPFGLRALYAQWNLDGSGPQALGRDEQKGWYVEPSFKLSPKFGVFARYNIWDNEASDATDSEKKQKDFGFNYWPHENVVVKFDVQRQSGTVNDDGFNLGVGYMF